MTRIHPTMMEAMKTMTPKQSGHTPGPWKVTSGLNQRWDVMGDVAVCRLFVDRAINGRAYGREEAESNARLIAAAPEMLEALTWVVENLANVQAHPEEYVHTASNKAAEFRAIIRKATGE